MSALFKAVLLVFCFAVWAPAQTRTLAVYASPSQGISPSSTLALEHELQRLLSPAGIDVIWRENARRKSGEAFDLVVVSTFDGSCSAEDLPGMPVSWSEKSISLADSAVVGGRVFPFFRVGCKRIVEMLTPFLRGRSPQVRHLVIGRALARVMAHEIYHVVAQTTHHQDSGVSKAGFGVNDLTIDDFSFDIWSLIQMRPAAAPAVASAEHIEQQQQVEEYDSLR
jgi:hypothetical protein